MQRILDANKERPFVDRVLNSQNYPKLDAGQGKEATHRMAWGETDGKYMAYPTILYDKETNELTERKGKEAFDAAYQSDNYIEFKTAEEADEFSRQYKSVWKKSRGPR